MRRNLSLVMIGLLLLGSCSVMSKMEETKSLTITTPEYSQLSDGSYRGAYDGGMVVAEVRVTLAGGKIKAVELLAHDHGRGGDAEKIVDDIVAAQSLEIDVVSGATISSKAILKAAERALQGEN